jgi:formylglycine-generating enzyme required for sulfatase activity/tRNA A-37 threonylcarbamoyl transferase component Bud32
MKVMLTGHYVQSQLASPSKSKSIARFLEEARVTGQLDHPGIVPVHELGIDHNGCIFFTMKLVEGRNLRRIFELASRGEEGWSVTRAVGVLLKVCEAMAYAHSKDVIHRDLKPANVMVGRFGEVYVMDWGVARAGGGNAENTDGSAVGVSSLRATSPLTSDPGLVTLADEIVGTPAYMAPELATADRVTSSPRTDVYSLGAMLYHLLARGSPFAQGDAAPSTDSVLERVLEGPPKPLLEIDPHLPRELIAICDKAMAREPERRYAGMLELADDLRAYLEGRVVGAQRAGSLAPLRKWIARNRSLSAWIAAACVCALFGAIALCSWRTSQANLQLLTELRAPSSLKVSYDDLWPPLPERVPAMQRWLADAAVVAADGRKYRRELEALRAQSLPYDVEAPLDRRERRPDEQSLSRADRLIGHYQQELARLTREGGTTWEGETAADLVAKIDHIDQARVGILAKVHPRQTWRFTNPIDELLHDRLAQIAPEVTDLAGPSVSANMIDRVRRAADFATMERSLSLDQPSAAWAAAIASIRDEASCPQYHGLELVPQLGLVPLGRDPCSGLWEFAHLQSGVVPERDHDGKLAIDDESCIVLVLIPGGDFFLGSQKQSANLPNYDALSQLNESPTAPIQIESFLVSKFEMTQAQWTRWTGANPSEIQRAAGSDARGCKLLPVESVKWGECMQVMLELGLTLPSEAQWEYAARAGTQTAWSTGAEAESLDGFANLAGPPDGKPCADSWEWSAPVGSFAANAWGLHDIHGNVAEWCRDAGESDYPLSYYLGTGERQQRDVSNRTLRGGSFKHGPLRARSAARTEVGLGYCNNGLGLRPVRELDR